MRKHLLYSLPLFISVISFGQDILVKMDSSRIEAKVLEIRPDEIKYKYFNYQDGPTVIVSKNEIAYVIYANGESERFQVLSAPTEQIVYITIDSTDKFKKNKVHKPSKLSDYINITVEAGMVMNESYANKPYRDYVRLGSQGSPEDETYSAPGAKSTKYGWSVGFNFLAGKSSFCKHIIGINYLNSTGEFNYLHSRSFYSNEAQAWIGYDREAVYKSTVHFINLLTGVRFIIHKKLCIDNVVLLNIPVKTVNRLNGYEVNYKISRSYYVEEVHNFDNEITHDSKVRTTVSFSPRLSYEFDMEGKQRLGIYFSYNFSYKYNLPWYMAGLTYYPFKKLR